MIITLLYILNIPLIIDKIFNILYTYNPDDVHFITGYNKKRELAKLQTGTITMFGVAIIPVLELTIYLLIYRTITHIFV